MSSLALAFVIAAAVSPCPTGSTVVLSCAAEKKQLAVCIDAATPPRFAQYRFGAKDALATKPELVVPKDVAEGFRPFAFARRDLIAGTSTTLSFAVGDVGYEVFTQDGKDAGGGVNVTRAGKLVASIACTGAIDERWDKLAPHVMGAGGASSGDAARRGEGSGGGKTPTRGGPLPNPTAGQSMSEICNDHVLLLTRYAWDDLHARGAFHKHCCVAEALGADDARCGLDWPSSDEPDCAFYDELRNGLFARYGYVFKDARWQRRFAGEPWYQPRADFNAASMPKIVEGNVAALKRLGCAKAASAACASAAVQWSLLLQKGAKGHMDGVQQSEIADALTAQCQSGWSDDVAACFAAGRKGCENQLADEQRTAAFAAVRAISPDAAPLP